MIQYIIQNARMMAGYTENMIKDIPDADLATPTGAIVNHPAWQIGHVTGGFAFAVKLCGGNYQPPEWTNACGGGKIPEADRSKFPSKDQMIADFKAAHEAAIKALSNVSPSILEGENPVDNFRAVFPKIGDAVVFLIEGHLANHAGQLAMWRREKGFKYMF